MMRECSLIDAEIDSLKRAFPTSIEKSAIAVFQTLNVGTVHEPLAPFSVVAGNETLRIPYRVHYSENTLNQPRNSHLQYEILNCLYSRHGDGYIRERCLKNIIASPNPWVVPYVVQLVGEYVVEILAVINQNLNILNQDVYSTFLRENKAFYELTKCRVISYWDCYYRWEYYRNRDDYPGFRIIKHFDALLSRG